MDRRSLWELSQKVGGFFKLTVLLQKRIRELVNGAPKLVEIDTEDFIAIAIKEVEEEKITLENLTEEELKSTEEVEKTAPPPSPQDVLLGKLPSLGGDK